MATEIKSVTMIRDSSFIEVGKNGVHKLLYHEPSGEGDTHYVDIVFENGRKIRVFRPDEIEFQLGDDHQSNSRDDLNEKGVF